MENSNPGTGVVRKGGALTSFNAGDAVAASVDVCGFPLAPSVRARLGKAGKALLEADFPPDIVVAAMVAAVRTSMFGSTETIAQELLVAREGKRVTRDRYRASLDDVSHETETRDSVVWQTLRRAMEGGSK
jgi:hypothetical protein